MVDFSNNMVQMLLVIVWKVCTRGRYADNDTTLHFCIVITAERNIQIETIFKTLKWALIMCCRSAEAVQDTSYLIYIYGKS